MSQNGIILPTTGVISGLTMTQDTNLAIQDLATQSAGAAALVAPLPFQRTARTDLGVIKRRNAANTGDVLDGALAETFVVSKAAGFTAALADFQRSFICSGTFTISLAAAAALGDGWFCEIKNNGSGIITIDPNASETIDGQLTLALSIGQSCSIYCDGTAIYTIGVLGIGQAIADSRYAALLAKANPMTVCFTKTASGAVSVLAGTSANVAGVKISFATQTAVVMPTLTVGTDYAIYICSDGTIRADSNFTNPAGYTTANSLLVGGFHYGLTAAGTTVAGGSFATTGSGMIWTQSQVDDIAGVNKYSLWDLKFRPYSDPRGMGLVDGRVWVDIYFCSTNPDTYGTSKAGTNIASGTVLPVIPAAFGGNGTTTYSSPMWWEFNEIAHSQKKRMMFEHEFVTAAYGVTESQSIDATASTYPTTQRNAGYTSKYGIEQASGHHWTWGIDSAGSASAWVANGGRGQSYNNSQVRVLLGGARTYGAYSGSRCSRWGATPAVVYWDIGLRAACDHMISV